MLIACATDRRYVEMTGVLLRSISAHPHREPIEFVVFCSGVSRSAKTKIASCASPGITASFVDLDRASHALLRALPTARHISPTAYACLLMPDLMPNREGRLLYLDCDMVVSNSLDPLFDIDLRGLPIGAVPVQAAIDVLAELNDEIGRAGRTPYFNSGLLLIDLDEWRRRKIRDRGLEYAGNRTGRVTHHDQAVLNRIVGADWLELDPRWNTSPAGLTGDVLRTIFILHFKGRLKPFHSNYVHEARKIYDGYRSQTPWSSARRVTPFRQRMRKRLDTFRNSLRKRQRKLADFLRK